MTADESGAQPGWYPDPEGTARQRYWDGWQWTQHYHPAEVDTDTGAVDTPGTRPRFGYRERSRRFMGIGGFVLAVCPFLTWANFVLLGGLNLFQVLKLSNDSTAAAWLLVLLGLGIAIYAARRTELRRVRRLGKVAGVILVLYLGVVLIQANDATAESGGLASLGIGPFAAFLGSVLVLLGGFLREPSPTGEVAAAPFRSPIAPTLASTERQQDVYCERCAARIDFGSRFCSDCGAPQAARQQLDSLP